MPRALKTPCPRCAGTIMRAHPYLCGRCGERWYTASAVALLAHVSAETIHAALAGGSLSYVAVAAPRGAHHWVRHADAHAYALAYRSPPHMRSD